MHDDVPFVSQRENGPKKWRRYGCGVASLMMLLKHKKNQPGKSIKLPSYTELGTALNVGVKATDKRLGKIYKNGEEGAYFQDITKWLKKSGISFQTASKKPDIFRILRDVPVMVGIDPNGVGHWIVLTDYDAATKRYSYLDPYLRTQVHHRKEERRKLDWDGYAIGLKD